MYNCPQCGEETSELHEGYCKPCCDENQSALDLHNASFDRWERMTDKERDNEISRTMRLAL